MLKHTDSRASARVRFLELHQGRRQVKRGSDVSILNISGLHRQQLPTHDTLFPAPAHDAPDLRAELAVAHDAAAVAVNQASGNAAQYSQMLLAQYALAAETVAKMTGNAGINVNALPAQLPAALAGQLGWDSG